MKRFRVHGLLAIFFVLMVLVGFWPTYFGPLLRGAATRPWVIHLHAAVYVGWLVLLLAQVTLAAQGRIAAHRKLGTFGSAYGALVFVMGLVVGFAAPLQHVAAGEWDQNTAAGFLLVPVGDMLLFGGFFAAAVHYCSRPEYHKRFILLANVALMLAAVGRMQLLDPPGLLGLAVWLSPLLIAMGYDIASRRRVHPVYWTGLAALLVVFARLFFLDYEPWLRIGRGLLAMQ